MPFRCLWGQEREGLRGGFAWSTDPRVRRSTNSRVYDARCHCVNWIAVVMTRNPQPDDWSRRWMAAGAKAVAFQRGDVHGYGEQQRRGSKLLRVSVRCSFCILGLALCCIRS